MKHSSRHTNRFDRHHRHGEQASASHRLTRELPLPDPATRVNLGPPTALRPASEQSRPGGGGIIVGVGIGGTSLAIGITAVQLLHLPSPFQFGVAAVSVLLAVASTFEGRRRRRRTRSTPVEVEVPLDVDLAVLTSQIGDLLTELRHAHGLAYRSHTWIDDVLPEFGGPVPQPLLARDLLAVAALDAGGIRADVAGLLRDHERSELVTVARAVRAALQSVLDACEGSADRPAPPTPDRSCWPVLTG
jgi:hypothetical protein